MHQFLLEEIKRRVEKKKNNDNQLCNTITKEWRELQLLKKQNTDFQYQLVEWELILIEKEKELNEREKRLTSGVDAFFGKFRYWPLGILGTISKFLNNLYNIRIIRKVFFGYF